MLLYSNARGSLIWFLIALLVWCPIHHGLASNLVDLTLPSGPNLKQVVKPFRRELLGVKDGPVEFPPIGNIRIVGTKLSSPFYFPVAFTFFARGVHKEPHSMEIESEFLEHLVAAQNGSFRSEWYHFNLAQLMSPANPWDPHKRTIVIVPGYRTNKNDKWMEDIGQAWLELEDVNVILVDWSKGNFGLYDTAAANVKIVSRQTTSLFYYLSQINQIDFYDESFRDKIQFVGHSLGAHISGNVGQDLGGRVSRITGLDPAGPIYDSLPSDEGLDPTDAKFVDIIHTNAGSMRNIYVSVGVGLIRKGASSVFNFLNADNKTFSSNGSQENLPDCGDDKTATESSATAWFGMENAIGHVDYYANGGSLQPGCNDELHACDHNRAIFIYLHALKHELIARESFKLDTQVMKRKLYRLNAFKASSHRDYRTGASLWRNCPELIGWMDFTLSDQQRRQAIQRCVIPIDFVARGSDFRRELEDVFELALDNNVVIENQESADFEEESEVREAKPGKPRFYFDTKSESPFVAEHHLLRLHMHKSDNEDDLLWKAGCRLTVKMNSNISPIRYSLADYYGDSLGPIENRTSSFYGLVMPFANPAKWQQKRIDLRNRHHDGLPHHDDASHFDRIFDQLSGYFPISLEFQLKYTTGKLRRAFDSLSSLLWKPKSSSTDACQLKVHAIEISPFDALYYNMSAWMNDDIDWRKVPISEHDATTINRTKGCKLDLKSSSPPSAHFFVDSFSIGQQTTLD